MLKVIDYLKKEKSNSEVPKILEEVQHIEQAQKFSKLKRYRRFDSDDEREKNTELFSAIRNGNLQKVQELLKVGVKVNIIDKNNAPLHYAIEKGNKEIVEELLLQKWKTDINAKNNKGDTPLHIATSKGNKELVQLLLSKQVKTDIKNNEGKTPLELAKDQEIINILKSGSALDYNDNHMLGQPGSSRQTEQFDNDVDKRLKEFVEDFVSIYEGYFSEYHKRLREQIPKSGKWADLINGVIEIGKSGTEGIEAAEIKAISVVAVSISRPFDSG